MVLRHLFSILTVALLTALTAGATTNDKKFVLVIDPGHGGKDPGAIGTYSKEKNINLNVALAFGKLVEANCPDVKVIYTRKTDVSVDLQERAAIANRAKADLFISIHTNALPKGRQAYGAETYTLGMARSAENLDVAKRENAAILVEDNYNERYAKFNPNSSESYIIFEFMQDEYMKQSVSLAKSIQKQYVKVANRQNKGVHQAGFLVLRETSMPSVLTELGFISTPGEEAYLNSDNGIKKLGRSIYEGFIDYKQSQDGKKRATPPYKEVDDTDTPAPSETQKKAEKQPQQQENKQTDDGIIIITDPVQQEEPQPKENNGGSVLGEQFGDKKNIEQQPVEKEEKTVQDVTSPQEAETSKTSGDIVFRIQFMTSDTPLKENDKRLQGINGLGSYTENGITKYTCMPTNDYNEAIKNQKEVRQKYPDAFVVAFRGEKHISLGEAIREYKSKKQ